jgi:hypothetical protein
MDKFEATAALVGLFALRCILPLAFTIALGYLMNRVADRWQAEDAARVAAVARPRPRRAPLPARQQPVITISCWLLNNCSPERRAKCPAYNNPRVACWAARSAAGGQMPAKCATCPIYAHAHVVIA